MSQSAAPLPDAKPARQSAIIHLARLMGSDAESHDILGLAQALAPLDYSDPQNNLLSLAIDRDGYGKRFSMQQLEQIAQCSLGGSDEAWSLANSPPLIDWLDRKLSNRSGPILPDLALKCIQLADGADLKRRGARLCKALLDKSEPKELGISAFVAASRRMGLSLSSLVLDGSDPPRQVPMAYFARDPDALDVFIAEGGNLRMDAGGSPLWEAWRDAAQRRRDDVLAKRLDSWAKEHESNRENQREISEYFQALSSYNGEEKLRGRKDWTELRDPKGRTTMMAMAQGRSASAKTWWDVKKALPAAAATDHDGRSLWHYYFAKGKDAAIGTPKFLAAHVPLCPDAEGCGILPSVWRMRDASGRPTSTHEWFFSENGTAKAKPMAIDWFGCANDSLATECAHFLIHERYIDKPEGNRNVMKLAQLTMELDDASFRQLHPAMLGALAFNLAICGYKSNTPEPQRVERLDLLLSFGAHVHISEERKTFLECHAHPSLFGKIEASFGAIDFRNQLGRDIPDPHSNGLAKGSARI